MTTRRDFLAGVAMGVAQVASASRAEAAPDAGSNPLPPGAPSTSFADASASGPAVSAATFAEAQKLVQVQLSDAERAQAALSWRDQMAPLYERRTGPKKLALTDSDVPALVWNPVLRGMRVGPSKHRLVRSRDAKTPLPKNAADIAFAPLTQLSRWIQSKQITSTKLTELYLERLERFQPQLLCTITLTKEHALTRAKQADAEIAAGKYRGPLHGIPYGVKDLLDTAGIATTYGAEPFRDRVPKLDSTVVKRLDAAGAVLVAKLSLGALALKDVWFGGQTKNPWLLEEGSSGSSAGPGSATAAGLVGFSIGSETEGSITSPSLRCGINGLRPTFGRVARTGAMTLCWSLDKLGPMCRSVEDTLLVLDAISGPDAGDLASVPSKLDFDASEKVDGLRLGFFPAWMKDATDVDRNALEVCKKLGMKPIEVALPEWPYGSLNVVVLAEAAAAFEELTLSHGVDQLRMQVPDAWPNFFRQSRFLSAVDLIQADRLRRKVAIEMAMLFEKVDVLLVPSLRDEMLTISNFTGHPSLTMRAGFVEISEVRSDWAPDSAKPPLKLNPPRRVPHGVTLLSQLFDEGTLGRVGVALERALNVMHERPPGFD